MGAINYREMRRMYDLDGPATTVANLREALQEGHLKPTDFSLRDLAEAVVPDGVEWVRSLRSGGTALTEAGDGVDVTAFSNITGQIFFSRLMEDYVLETQFTDQLVETVPSQILGTEKIAGVDSLADDAQVVNEGMPYPNYGFGEEYIEIPSKVKRGFIIPVTKEAIFADLTGKVLSRAGSLGQTLGLNKSKRIWNMVLGLASTFATGGKWKYNGTEYDVYDTTAVDITAGQFYINEITDALENFTDLDAALQLFSNMVDPVTGESIVVSGQFQFITTPALSATARSIINATQIRKSTDTAAVVTLSADPISGEFAQPMSSALMRSQLITEGSLSAANANKRWLVGNFPRAFAYYENWPIQVLQAPPNSQKEFEQDIVVQFRADERGNVAVKDPHFVVRSLGTG